MFRSRKNFLSTPLSTSSSGGGDLGHRQGVQPRAQVGQGGRPGRGRRAGGEQQARAVAAPARLIRWNRASASTPWSASSSRAGRPAGGGHVRARRGRGPRALARAAQARARWVLPTPSGPTSARRPPGQRGQASSAADGLGVGGAADEAVAGMGGGPAKAQPKLPGHACPREGSGRGALARWARGRHFRGGLSPRSTGRGLRGTSPGRWPRRRPPRLAFGCCRSSPARLGNRSSKLVMRFRLPSPAFCFGAGPR